MRVFLAFLLALGLASPAQAYLKAGPIDAGSGHRLQGMIAPLDGAGGFGTPAAAYSLRKLKSTYAGPAIKLRRASDNATQDINFLGFTGFTGAPIDTAAAASFCAATSCFYATWYDQSGNGRNLGQGTLANQPAYVADCGNGRPCARATVSGQNVVVGISASPATMTLNGVGRQVTRTAPGGYYSCTFAAASSEIIFQHADYDLLIASSGAVDILAGATAGQFHSHTGVYSGAGGVVRVDDVETAGAANAPPSAQTVIWLGNQDASTCNYTEMVQWFDYALSAGERAALAANQRNFWGF